MSGRHDYWITPEVERGLRILAWLVRRWRAERRVSQGALEAWSGLDQTTISRLENARLRSLRLHRLAALIAALHPGFDPADPTRR